MKRTLISATIAALTVPVALAAPAHASNDVHIRVDPRDWAFSGSISIYSLKCGSDGIGECEKSDMVKTQDFNVEPGVPMQNILDWTWDAAETYIVELSDVTLTGLFRGKTLRPPGWLDVCVSRAAYDARQCSIRLW
jgi:non-ribosomal peptide synthetase component F